MILFCTTNRTYRVFFIPFNVKYLFLFESRGGASRFVYLDVTGGDAICGTGYTRSNAVGVIRGIGLRALWAMLCCGRDGRGGVLRSRCRQFV